MKTKLFLFIGIIIPIFVSSQVLDTNFIDNRLHDYLFENGSFWVYEKADSTNVIDSLVQTELIHAFNPQVNIHGDPILGAVEYFKAFYESKTYNYQTWDQYIGYVIVKEGVDWGNNGQYIFLSSYINGDKSNGAEIIKTIDTFKLNNFDFYNVTKMFITHNIFENNNPTCYYFAKGIGIIRKEIFLADTSNLQVVWNIKNWQVNKMVNAIQYFENGNKLAAYPNPTNGLIHLSVNQNDLLSNLTLYDFTGKIVYKERILKKEIDLDLNNCIKGIYIVAIEDKNNRKSLKIYKK